MQRDGVGIWSSGVSFRDPHEAADAVGELEALGYTSVWMPGVDSVCIQVVTGGERGGMVDLPLDIWLTLAPALTGTT
jgi:hypothetical protein